MHFVGMNSITLRYDGQVVPVSYEPGFTALSLFVAVAIICAGFWLAGDPNNQRLWRHLVGGLAGGAGVGIMHYSGMMAMSCPCTMKWNVGIIVLSIFVGVFAATAALLIFFRFQSYWARDYRVLVASALVMGIAVCSMHYTGTLAATWELDPNAPWEYKYTHGPTLVYIIVPLCICASLGMVGLITFQQWQLRRVEVLKSNYLTLSCLVVDDRGRILATTAGTLPSVVVEHKYEGQTSFDQYNTDFLRMLKCSFSWSSVHKYQNHLKRLHHGSHLSSYSLSIFEKFVQAARNLADQLEVPFDNLGIMYFSPTNARLTLVLTTRRAQNTESLKFTDPSLVYPSLLSYLDENETPEDWVSKMINYVRRVELRANAQSADGDMEDVLKRCAEDLLVDKEDMLTVVHEWRKKLGSYVTTRRHLRTLVSCASAWSRIQLDPMVIAQIEKTVLASSNDVASQVSSLYVGLLHVQVGASGARVLVPRDGPYSMVPLARFGNAHNITPAQWNWIRHLGRSDWSGFNLVRDSDFWLSRENKEADFARDFFAGVADLARLVGTNRDLTAGNLYTIRHLMIAEDMKVVMFIVVHMGARVPEHYPASAFVTLPLRVFEILHFAQCKSLAVRNWPDELLQSRTQLALARAGDEGVTVISSGVEDVSAAGFNKYSEGDGKSKSEPAPAGAAAGLPGAVHPDGVEEVSIQHPSDASVSTAATATATATVAVTHARSASTGGAAPRPSQMAHVSRLHRRSHEDLASTTQGSSTQMSSSLLTMGTVPPPAVKPTTSSRAQSYAPSTPDTNPAPAPAPATSKPAEVAPAAGTGTGTGSTAATLSASDDQQLTEAEKQV